METDLEVPSPGPSPKGRACRSSVPQQRAAAAYRSSVPQQRAAAACRSSVPQEWIAERLKWKSAAYAIQQIRRFHQVPDRELPGEVRA